MDAMRVGTGMQDLLHIYAPPPEHWIAVTPNGRFVAFVVKDPLENVVPTYPTFTPPHLGGFRLRVADIETGHTYAPMDDGGRSFAPVWCPGGTRLAFYGDHDGKVRLYVWSLAIEGGHARRVCDDPVRCFPWVERLHWLDDDHICLSLLPEKDGFSGYTHPSAGARAKDSAVFSEHHPPNVATAEEMYWEGSARVQRTSERAHDDDDPWYRARADIGIVNVTTGGVRRIVTNFGAKASFPSPDGKNIAFTTVPTAKTIMDDNRPDPSEKIYVMGSDGKATPILVTGGLPFDPWRRVVWSPTSEAFAFVQNNQLAVWSGATNTLQFVELGAENQGKEIKSIAWDGDGDGWLVHCGSELTVIRRNGDQLSLKSPEGKQVIGIVGSTDGGYFWKCGRNSCVVWTRDAQTGDHGFFRIPLDGSQPDRMMEEPGTIDAVAFGGGSPVAHNPEQPQPGRVVFWKESYRCPPELFSMDGISGCVTPITRLNRKPNWLTGVGQEQLSWGDARGRTRRGTLLVPDRAIDKKWPVVAIVYPNYAASNGSNAWGLHDASAIMPPQLLLKHGIAVFLPDLFTGEGDFMTGMEQAFTKAVGAATGSGIVDSNRIGVMGHSFGGYLVNCLLTRIEFIKAAVSSGSFANLSALWATSFSRVDGRLDAYGVQLVETNPSGPELGCAPWENPEAFTSHSPIFALHHVNAPLLLVGGADDPLFQPDDMLLGLERLGKDVQCVRYISEEHTPRDWRMPNRTDVARRIVHWFVHHLGVHAG